ncbi:MAG: type II toxin-antitoxin system VapC family toxin [Desulfobacterales bacterium]
MIAPEAIESAIRGKKLLIDSNIIIYLTEEIEPYFSLSQILFSIVENGGAKAVISILSVAEVMQGPLKAGETEIAEEVQNYLVNFPNCQCLDVTYAALQLTGKDKTVNWKKLRTVDSLIIATGLQYGVDLFVSNDLHFKKALTPEMILSLD